MNRGSVANIPETVSTSGREQHAERIAGDRFGALAFPRPRRCSYGGPDDRLQRRGGEDASQLVPIVSVNQLASRRRIVSGACGPDGRRNRWSRRLC